jgi:hypothetical protein
VSLPVYGGLHDNRSERGGDNGSPKQDKIERRWTVSWYQAYEREPDNSGGKDRSNEYVDI